MSKTLDQAREKVMVAKVERTGERMIIPSALTLKDARVLIDRLEAYETEETIVRNTFNAFPWDGAKALYDVIAEKYGWAQQVATPTMFGEKPPELRSIEVGYGEFTKIPWGRLEIPGVKGFIETGVGEEKGLAVFTAAAKVLRRDAEVIEEIFAKTRERLVTHSIYRGKPLRMRFRDNDGDRLQIPELNFMYVAGSSPETLIYNDDVMAAVHTNLFTPVSRAVDCLSNRIPVKRGVLLGGVFGTGKTMAAAVAGHLAEKAGITFLYIPRVSELPDAILFAKQYQSPACVIFCEDIDRVMGGERSVGMDDILNTIDGIDSKTANIIVVLTTNNLDGIHPAMLRPGRLDAVIEIPPPNAKSVEKLIRLYGGTTIRAETDLTEAGKYLEGRIPAIVAEAVKRAKLSQLAVQMPGTHVVNISAEAVTEAARTMAYQIELLERRSNPKEPELTIDLLLAQLVATTVDTALGNTPRDARQVKKMLKAVGL